MDYEKSIAKNGALFPRALKLIFMYEIVLFFMKLYEIVWDIFFFIFVSYPTLSDQLVRFGTFDLMLMCLIKSENAIFIDACLVES